jgi:hypothetical protein
VGDKGNQKDDDNWIHDSIEITDLGSFSQNPNPKLRKCVVKMIENQFDKHEYSQHKKINPKRFFIWRLSRFDLVGEVQEENPIFLNRLLS